MRTPPAVRATQPGMTPVEGDTSLWSALLAGIVGCGVPLAQGLLAGWPATRSLSYAILALLYLLLTQCQLLPFGIGSWLSRHLGSYLLLIGMVAFLLQSISADPLVQPIVFTIPLVQAALNYPAWRTALVGAGYLGLMGGGLWLGGQRGLEALLFPVAAYGALMGFMYAFTRMAADLAAQRDYLQRLIEITATLTRDLDLVTVLEQVAAEGRTLAHAGQARVWLRETRPDEQAGPAVWLAAVVPAGSSPPPAPEAMPVLSSDAAAIGDALLMPLIAKGAHIGALELRDRAAAPFTAEDVRLLQPFADVAAVAIENARLYEQARASATLAERNRLARELHDTIAQGLTAVTMQIEASQRGLDRAPERARARLERAHALARQTLEDVRRSVWTLASPLVDGAALSEALADLVGRFAARTGLQVDYDHSGPAPELGHGAATQALRIVQEALQNVEKHARATAVSVGSATGPDDVRVWVRDNGAGFTPGAAPNNAADGSGFGMLSLRERARLAGGTLQVESTPGVGTCVTLVIPV